MAQKMAERLVWAVETLAIDPADHVLEIGCGHGVAVSLICERLTSGKITAIDRSEVMINMARSRNSQHVASGKAVFQTVALAEADFGQERFNKIFAVHVNLFWQQPARKLVLIKKLLTPGGALYLFYQPPLASKIQELVDKLTKILQGHGFSIKQVLFKDLKPVPAMGIIAEVS
jgi:ubiquinone/menaquinone biosynthesis C-methylase UbiE